MFSSHDLLVDVLVREREREGEKAAALHAGRDPAGEGEGEPSNETRP